MKYRSDSLLELLKFASTRTPVDPNSYDRFEAPPPGIVTHVAVDGVEETDEISYVFADYATECVWFTDGTVVVIESFMRDGEPMMGNCYTGVPNKGE